jgi:uncharacterized repeat protein (TIGR01451 family)
MNLSFPVIWRAAMVALSALILCSCRGPAARQGLAHGPDGAVPAGAMPAAALAAPGGAYGPAAAGPYALDPSAYQGYPSAANFPVAPMPYSVMGDWAPEGLERPWPQDEYIRDGGDAGLPANANADWQVLGLNVEDTVGHYDTVDGRIIVEPSNRVYIYAPRFAAVRNVRSVIQDAQVQGPIGYDLPVTAVRYDESQVPASSLQREQAVADIGRREVGSYVSAQGLGHASIALLPYQFQNRYLPFEDLVVVRTGIFEQAEKARLAEGVDSAIVWTKDVGVQVAIDGQVAAEFSGDQRAQATYTIDSFGAPRLRVIKVASRQEARPGETIDFTIRFDNTGSQVMGNVTILDNLSPRLEYVEDTAQSSVAAEFLPERNEVGSLVMRWEITDPLEPGQGGIVRFQCRVR